jgi:hypothetical protein
MISHKIILKKYRDEQRQLERQATKNRLSRLSSKIPLRKESFDSRIDQKVASLSKVGGFFDQKVASLSKVGGFFDQKVASLSKVGCPSLGLLSRIRRLVHELQVVASSLSKVDDFLIKKWQVCQKVSLKIRLLSSNSWPSFIKFMLLPSKFTQNQAGCLSFPQNSLKIRLVASASLKIHSKIRLLSSNSWPSFIKFMLLPSKFPQKDD